jgi:hypothetical protein
MQMKRRIKTLNEDRINGIAEVIEANKGNRKMYEYARMLAKNKTTRYKVMDELGFMQSDPRKTIEPTTAHYRDFFNREGEIEINMWRGDKRPLNEPITANEVEEAIRRLNRYRATGPDGIAGELFKGGGPEMTQFIAEMFNEMFEKHSEIEEINQGYLFPINKDKGPQTAKNTRPIILLNILRKILSNVLLDRIREAVELYLPANQYAYRTGKSTTEITWTIQTLKAVVERFKERYNTTSLDLSKAFDSISRAQLLEIFERVNNRLANEDEMRILQYLLSNTNLRVKVNQEVGEVFRTFIGTPQGDALSPILFIVYLEEILREHEKNFPSRGCAEDYVLTYADDIQFSHHDRNIAENHPNRIEENCKCSICQQQKLKLSLPIEFAKKSMEMNVEKTTFSVIMKYHENNTKFVGSQLTAEAEISTRIQRADTAFFAAYRIWIIGNKISAKTKLND